MVKWSGLFGVSCLNVMGALYSEKNVIMQSETYFLPRKTYCMELQWAKKR